MNLENRSLEEISDIMANAEWGQYTGTDIKDLLEYVENEITENPEKSYEAIHVLHALGKSSVRDVMDKESRLHSAALMGYLQREYKAQEMFRGTLGKNLDMQHYAERMCSFDTTYKELWQAVEKISLDVAKKRETARDEFLLGSIDAKLEEAFEIYTRQYGRDFSDGDLWKEVVVLGNYQIAETTENNCLDALVRYGQENHGVCFSENYVSTLGQLLKHSSTLGLTDKEVDACAAVAGFDHMREYYIMDALTEKVVRDIDKVPGEQLLQQLAEGYKKVLLAAPENSRIHDYLSNLGDRRLKYLDDKVSPQAEGLCMQSLVTGMIYAAGERPAYAGVVMEKFKESMPQILGNMIAENYGEASFSIGMPMLQLIERTANSGIKGAAGDCMGILAAALKDNQKAAGKKNTHRGDLVVEHIGYTAAKIIEAHSDCAESGMVVLNALANMRAKTDSMHQHLFFSAKILAENIIKAKPELKKDCVQSLKTFLKNHPKLDNLSVKTVLNEHRDARAEYDLGDYDKFHRAYIAEKKAELVERLAANNGREGELSGTVIASKIADGVESGVIDAPKTPEQGKKLAEGIQRRITARKKGRS